MSDTDALTQIDAAILAVATQIAAGSSITEYTLGGVRIKKDSPAELLKALKQIRKEYVGIGETTRSAGICTWGGVQ